MIVWSTVAGDGVSEHDVVWIRYIIALRDGERIMVREAEWNSRDSVVDRYKGRASREMVQIGSFTVSGLWELRKNLAWTIGRQCQSASQAEE